MVNAGEEAAPGRLELVRSLLNTWLIPNDTRIGVDRLGDLQANPEEWQSMLGQLSRPRGRAELLKLEEVRDRLRGLVERADALDADAHWLQSIANRHPERVLVAAHEGQLLVTRSAGRAEALSEVVGAVIDAVEAGTWSRLKSCPGCRWVFWDHSRSNTKRWCGMNRNGPKGRACGSIAKVQAFRERQRAQGRP